MDRSLKRKVVAGTVAAIAVGGAGAGIAATQLRSSPGEESKAVISDAAKKRRGRGQLGPAPADQAGEVDAPEVVRTLQEALGRLSPRDQLVLELRYRENLSNSDVASRLGINQGAAKKAAHDARERLRRFLMDAGLRYE